MDSDSIATFKIGSSLAKPIAATQEGNISPWLKGTLFAGIELFDNAS